MKLIKLIMVGVVTLTMVFAQNQQQGGQQQGGQQQGGQQTQGEGQDGPPPLPFDQVDVNDDGVISEDEARAVYGTNPDGTVNEEFDEGWNDADADSNGEVDQAEYDAALQDSDDEDHQEGHGECRVCGLQMNSEDDWKQHCEENWEHCKPQAGDVCGFAGPDGQGEQCDYVHTGEEGEDHHHCDHCGLAVNSGDEMHEHLMAEHPDNMEDHQEGHGECRVCGLQMNSDDDWRQHCDENWEHCKPQAGDVCGFAGPDGQGEQCDYVHTGEEGEDHHHCDHCGIAVNSGEEMHEHMMAEHPDNMEDHQGDQDHQGGAPDNHWDGNQDAICGDMPEYWLDTDHDGVHEGPYARWDEDQDGNPVDCYKDGPGGPNGPGGPDGPDPAVAEAFFSTLGSGGSFEDAFEAAANVALEQDQQADDYDEELWNNCKEVGRNAMQAALDSGEEDPENVFGAIAMAVGACADPGQN